MGCSFSNQQNLHASLKRIKRDNIIHAASLNYCGILKSPFEFYSGQFHENLKKLSSIFEKLKGKYVKINTEQPYSWQFGKLDKKVKEKRYCPLYNIHAGIVNNKFISKKTFTALWHEALQKVQKGQNLQITASDREEALQFDMLAYHTLLYYVYEVEDIDQMENKDSKKYLQIFQPFFEQAFLDEDKKISKFTKGLQKTMTDVIFIQQGNQKLIDALKVNPKYHIEVSPDLDTMICLKKDRFKVITPLRSVTFLSEEEKALLDWNGHSTILVVDKLVLISGHLSSNKKSNAENIQTLKKGLQLLRQKHPDYEFLCGADLNSFLKEFNSQIHIFPKTQGEWTSLKMRTSMQTQSNKAEVLSKQSKDAIITTLPILTGEISTINLKKIDDTCFLPEDSHPFDHFLIFAQINIEKLGTDEEMK